MSNRRFFESMGATFVANRVDVLDFVHDLKRNRSVANFALPPDVHFPLCVAYGVAYGTYGPGATALQPLAWSTRAQRMYQYCGHVKPATLLADVCTAQDPSMTVLTVEPRNHMFAGTNDRTGFLRMPMFNPHGFKARTHNGEQLTQVSTPIDIGISGPNIAALAACFIVTTPAGERQFDLSALIQAMMSRKMWVLGLPSGQLRLWRTLLDPATKSRMPDAGTMERFMNMWFDCGAHREGRYTKRVRQVDGAWGQSTYEEYCQSSSSECCSECGRSKENTGESTIGRTDASKVSKWVQSTTVQWKKRRTE